MDASNFAAPRPPSGQIPGERRAKRRYAVAVPVELRPDGGGPPIRLQTSDISEGGCYVEMTITLPLGSQLTAILWVNQERVEARATVVTLHPQFGNGIQFTSFREDGAQKLGAFLLTLDK